MVGRGREDLKEEGPVERGGSKKTSCDDTKRCRSLPNAANLISLSPNYKRNSPRTMPQMMPCAFARSRQ